jgi:two-component system NtrC family sensor kinase
MSPTPGSALFKLQQTIADLQRQLDERAAERDEVLAREAAVAAERDEALARETATAEVLGVINSSPGDLAPVFDAMLEKALHLCGAAFGILRTYDGTRFHTAATRGVPEIYAEFLRTNPQLAAPGTLGARIAAGEPVVHVLDRKAEAAYQEGEPHRRASVDLGGGRTTVAVPLTKDRRLVGAIEIYRQHVEAFSDKQIALLQNFAAQAVIAIENARLITETREALEQQTATAEVLGVINSSPGDLAPVFKVILEKAHNLCGATIGALESWDGEHIRAVATRGLPASFEALVREGYRPTADDPHWRLLDGDAFVHIPDQAAIEEPTHRKAVELGIRTFLGIALRKDDVLLGRIVAARREVRPFSEQEIALLRNFAVQAVIAMENARLLSETREALEQQTATAEVLGVINSSPGELAPVFDAILAKAHTLCGIAQGSLELYDGERFRAVACRGLTESFAQMLRQGYPAADNPATRALIEGERFTYIPDLAATEYSITRTSAETEAVRTLLCVPLRREGRLLGMIASARREVRPFSEKEIALLENFATQAVIAMENARLITETREALEQQTATSGILRVVSRSQSDVQPVFEAIVESASRLCEATYSAVARYEDGQLHLVATNNMSAEETAAFHSLFPRPPLPSFAMGRAFCEGRSVQIEDALNDPRYDPRTLEVLQSVAQYRTYIGIPIVRDGEAIGVIGCGRREVRPFTDKQIELVETFADQAVIAIENARLITETREALEQQTATAEVLGVINSSPGDLAPVFEAMLERALRLCGASFGELRSYDGEQFSLAATRGAPPAYAEYYARQDAGIYAPGTGPARLLKGEPFVHIPDLIDTEPYKCGDSDRLALVEIAGARAYILVPLLQDQAVCGFILIYRKEPGPFSEKQIGLLQSFAAQAVIAIDNARLLDEIRQRQAELRVTFDNMGDGVAMFDADPRLAAWNLNFQRILDLPDELLSARPSYADYIRLLANRGEFGSDDIEAELSARLEHTDQELRLERIRPDGHVIEVRRNTVPGGGFVLIYSDVTERKRAEAEIRAARDAAEGALRELQTAQASLVHAQKMAALGQLTAGIAHEIKNPLNFVNNFAGLSVELLDELKEAAAPGFEAMDQDARAEIDETVATLTSNLEKIAEHGRRADGIVRSMLEHSRGGSGERRAVDLNALIDEALNLAYHGARAQDQSFNITMEREFDQGLAPIEVVPQDLTRVFLNLFGNGFYAASKRGNGAQHRPVLRVTTRDLGETVEIRVRDNGTGIAPEIRDKLFQPFVTTKPTGEGTGLGLSISYEIVTQQHGGTIEVDSEIGQFTEFRVRLPR